MSPLRDILPFWSAGCAVAAACTAALRWKAEALGPGLQIPVSDDPREDGGSVRQDLSPAWGRDEFSSESAQCSESVATLRERESRRRGAAVTICHWGNGVAGGILQGPGEKISELEAGYMSAADHILIIPEPHPCKRQADHTWQYLTQRHAAVAVR